MRIRRLALTGPPAAAFHGLDGFRDLVWPDLWCAPAGGAPGARIIRMSDWPEPTFSDDVAVAPVGVVLRHLNAVPLDLSTQPDGIASADRVELAVEHALRGGVIPSPSRGRAGPGDQMLRAVLARRGPHPVPATGSYAETRAVQLLRSWDLMPWRQVAIHANGRIAFRADFMLPIAPRRRRPDVVQPTDGLLVEVDSREFHANDFDHDKRRGATYDALGFNWISITPNQIEHQPMVIARALDGAMGRVGRRAGHRRIA